MYRERLGLFLERIAGKSGKINAKKENGVNHQRGPQTQHLRIARLTSLPRAHRRGHKRREFRDVHRCRVKFGRWRISKWFFVLMQIKILFTRKVLHFASFWKW